MPLIHIIERLLFDANVFHVLEMNSPRIYMRKLHLRSEKWIKATAENVGKTRNLSVFLQVLTLHWFLQEAHAGFILLYQITSYKPTSSYL